MMMMICFNEVDLTLSQNLVGKSIHKGDAIKIVRKMEESLSKSNIFIEIVLKSPVITDET